MLPFPPVFLPFVGGVYRNNAFCDCLNLFQASCSEILFKETARRNRAGNSSCGRFRQEAGGAIAEKVSNRREAGFRESTEKRTKEERTTNKKWHEEAKRKKRSVLQRKQP